MKIGIIIKREYLTRVKKRSFLIITFLAPLFFAALIFLPVILMNNSDKFDQKRTFAVCDSIGFFEGKFENTEYNTFVYDNDFDNAKKLLTDDVYDGVLYIPATKDVHATLYSKKQIPMTVTTHIRTTLKNAVEHQILLDNGIDTQKMNEAKMAAAHVNLQSILIDEKDGSEKSTSSETSFILGIFLSIIIYFVIFLFGQQVMRGVIEEKSNRIIEVIVSSVKPFELMMGKTIGVALVGLTQFVLWILLTLAISGIASSMLPAQEMVASGTVMSEQVTNLQPQTNTQTAISEVFAIIDKIPVTEILVCFLLFFIGGYFLYSAMFAAIGAAVDNETDTQQFATPISLMLVIPMICSSIIANAPDSSIAVWMSMIPFTSPVAMMLRIPFGVPLWQIVTSIALLFATFVIFTWIASKIYRTGILMYGKKVSWKEIFKWIKY